MGFVDSHNHLQDPRFAESRDAILSASIACGVVFSALNGTHPDDWDCLASLAAQHPFLIPNFGVHPWYIQNLPPDWEAILCAQLSAVPSGVGEIGIDGWRKEFDSSEQERIFVKQLVIAAERNIPASIHGLRRWGRLLELLRENPRPLCGFLLHSYGGPREMIDSFAELGGYFSCPGFFLTPGREMKLEVFRHVPEERLLLETDAPDQKLPESLDHYKLLSSENQQRLNHPATIAAVYRGVAQLRGISSERLAEIAEKNFRRLFATVLARRGQLSPPEPT